MLKQKENQEDDLLGINQISNQIKIEKIAMLNGNFQFDSKQSIKESKNSDNLNYRIKQTNEGDKRPILELIDDTSFSVSNSEVDIALQKEYIGMKETQNEESRNELKMAVLWSFNDQNNQKVFGLSTINETVNTV